jgi:aspartyl-tRNA(Asn)/glutamyl-tRNA(Gln) amidotransferase subunit A
MSAGELLHLSISELLAGYRSGAFTPVDVAHAGLALAARVSELNCFIELDEDRITAQARELTAALKSDSTAPLFGIPVGIKDLICTKGVRTTAASKMLKGYVPPYDATVVRHLAAARSISFGKLNMDEFAMGSSNENSAFGEVRNPWDKAKVPGGSSGGSAASVAAGICRATLGTDTGGSIRQPAAFCGIVGIKPTYGRVSRFGVVAFASSLDQVGVFGKTVQDAASVLEVISGHDQNDATSSDQEVPRWAEMAISSTPLKGVRVGIPKEYFVGGLDTEITAALDAAKSKLCDLGAIPVDVSLPHTEMALPVYYILAPAEAASNLARYDGVRYGHRASDPADLMDLYVKSRSEGFGKEVQRRILVGNYVLSSGYYDAFYIKAQKVRTLIAKDFENAFSTHCDVIFAPVTPTPPFEVGAKVSDPLQMYLNDIFTIPVNLAGLPGMSVPCGFTKAGLPIGMQLIGKAFDESTLFKVAAAYESATDWHRKTPTLS